ncbi:MAG: hypothetical protein WCG80_10610 [Spirochaetales bacterium]
MDSREDWKKFLLTLPDAAFFSLARHYLGELQTPFTKHRIIVDLQSVLAKPEWKQARRDLLTDEDIDLLTAIQILGTPSPEQTASFLGWSLPRLNARSLNLQERFLIYPRLSGKTPELCLSPLVTEDEQLMAWLHPGRLYPSVAAPEPALTTPWLSEGTLLALLSFVLEVPLEKTAAGAWKKKPRQEFLERFAALGDAEGIPRADLLLHTAEHMGLILWQEGKTVPVWSYWDDFRSLPRPGRLALLWLAAAYPAQGPLFEAARWLSPLVLLLPPGRAFGLTTLIRLSSRLPALGGAKERDALFRSWIRWGLLLPGPVADTWMPSPVLRQFEAPAGGSWVQANFELRLPCDLDLAKAWPAVLASRLVRWDRTILWELGKVPVKRALSRGVTAKELETTLEGLTGVPLTQNLRISLQEWEKEFQSLRLWKGLVLTVGEDRRHLIEHTEGFAKAILHEFAPGVWLVREDLLPEWSKELEQKGLPSLPDALTGGTETDWGRPWTFSGWHIEASADPGPLPPLAEAPPFEPRPTDLPDLVRQLLKKLETLPFGVDEKEEWKARILRRIVLEEEQLKHPLSRGERSEAKGLDFAGKIRLAEQALGTPTDLLEVSYRAEDGTSASALLRPVRLEKSGPETILHAERVDTNLPFQAWISRLSQVKKIRGSLLF